MALAGFGPRRTRSTRLARLGTGMAFPLSPQARRSGGVCPSQRIPDFLQLTLHPPIAAATSRQGRSPPSVEGPMPPNRKTVSFAPRPAQVDWPNSPFGGIQNEKDYHCPSHTLCLYSDRRFTVRGGTERYGQHSIRRFPHAATPGSVSSELLSQLNFAVLRKKLFGLPPRKLWAKIKNACR